MNRTTHAAVAAVISLTILGFVFCTAAVAAAPTTEPSLGQKIVAYCRDHKGKQVGDGQCAALAYWAMKDCGGKRRAKDSPNDGDYVWGDLVLLVEGDAKMAKFSNGKAADLRPGDIIQFRDTAFISHDGKRTHTAHFGHHTAVLGSAQGSNIQIWQQNFAGVLDVTTYQLRMADLKEGWLRFYRPIPRGSDSSSDEAPKKTKDDESSSG